jgi:hypothetical protein
MNLLIDGYKLVLTCYACPEQYDVFDDEGNQVAYLRLRHGQFTVECPDCGGETVYAIETLGDGIFVDDERYFHLREAITKIQKWIIKEQFKPEEPGYYDE